MNIFFLDTDPSVAARLQVTKSATKMILESAQLASTALRQYGYSGDDVYKTAHLNHPSSIWTRKSRSHLEWLLVHALELCERYTQQFHKIHKSQAVIERCIELLVLVPDRGFTITQEDLAIKSTDVGLKALDQFKKSARTFQDAVEAYRSFYFAKDYVIDALANGERLR
jgi:hypothetical protein